MVSLPILMLVMATLTFGHSEDLVKTNIIPWDLDETDESNDYRQNTIDASLLFGAVNKMARTKQNLFSRKGPQSSYLLSLADSINEMFGYQEEFKEISKKPEIRERSEMQGEGILEKLLKSNKYTARGPNSNKFATENGFFFNKDSN